MSPFAYEQQNNRTSMCSRVNETISGGGGIQVGEEE